MKLVIVSGISGAGKSIALNTLEDLGFYCTDNLPVTLLSAFAQEMVDAQSGIYDRVGVGIDARNPAGVLSRIPVILNEMRARGINCQLVFLDADDAILVKRFSETRRKHPLTNDHVSLAEAIAEERLLLAPLSEAADIRINTSGTNLHQLRDIIRERVGERGRFGLSLLIESFGFKHGAPADADFVFDVRCLPNPHWDPQLRTLTGLHEPVAEYLQNAPMVTEMYEDVRDFLAAWIPRFRAENRAYLTVAIGCTGGQHRSVYLADRLGRHFKTEYGDQVIVRHRELS